MKTINKILVKLKPIKNVIFAVVSVIAGIFAFFLISKKIKSKKIEKLDKNVAENKQKVEALETQVKQVKDKRKTVKSDIDKAKQKNAKLEKQKAKLVIEEKPTKDVKDNILKQTRRGRPKKA